MNKITNEKLEKYFKITKEALEKVKKAKKLSKDAEIVIDMVSRYFEDAKYFKNKGDMVTAFAALNYAHGWLDAGARLKLYDVKDSRLFASD